MPLLILPLQALDDFQQVRLRLRQGIHERKHLADDGGVLAMIADQGRVG